jgi:8-oxo-dGTP pyrophosphatase MutT (NUDIX family)/predicted kinase
MTKKNRSLLHTMKTLPDGAHALLVTPKGEVMLVLKGPKYTFNPHNAGKVGMFGGGIETSEAPERALARELEEELELDIRDKQVTPLGSYQKTITEDASDCTVHVFVVYDVDPTTLTLHEGIDEDTEIQDNNSAIMQGAPEALLARTDLTRVTRLALEDYVVTRCVCQKPEYAEMLRIFEETIALPPKPSRPQFLVCPIGEIGAGKSTVLKPLSKRLSLLRFEGDDLRKVFREHGYTFDDLYDCSESVLWKYAQQGYSIAIDGDCSSTRMQNTIRALQLSCGVQVFWIHINPPEDFIINKLRTYTHTWLFRDGEHAVEDYKKRKATREHPDVPFIYEFDPSRDDLHVQIEEAAQYIEQRLSA